VFRALNSLSARPLFPFLLRDLNLLSEPPQFRVRYIGSFMSSSQKNYPKVGIGVIVVKNGKLLMGKRINTHGGNTWSLPGGKLEFNETWEECAIRECSEETGIKIKNPVFFLATNDIMKEEGKHYITIYMKGEYELGEASVIESDKFIEVGWFDLNDLPLPRFLSLSNLWKKLKLV